MAEAVAAKVENEGPGGSWVLVLMQGVVAIIIGALLLFSPVITTVVLVQVLAWFWIITGAMGLLSLVGDRTMWGLKLFSGMISILAGLFVVSAPLMGAFALLTVYIIILGINGIISGCVDIWRAFKGSGWGTGLLGVLNIVFGMLLLAYFVQAALVTPMVLGFIAMGLGILAIVFAFVMRKKMK